MCVCVCACGWVGGWAVGVHTLEFVSAAICVVLLYVLSTNCCVSHRLHCCCIGAVLISC